MTHTNSQIKLKRMRLRDLKHAYYLQKHSFGNQMFMRFGSLLDNWLPGHYIYLVYVPGIDMAVGMIGYYFTKHKTLMHYTTLCVDSSQRGMGVGTRTIYTTFLPEFTHGAKSCIFEVRSKNQTAISIYEHIGFKTIKKRLAWYKDPVDDAIIMGMETDLMHKKAREYFANN